MIPKSNANLTEGDFCLVPREDGKYVPFVYVGKRASERSSFFGAFANVVVANPPDPFQNCVQLLEHALLHIKCFKENNTPIVGNLRQHLDEGVLADIAADIQRSEIGHTTRVWGWRTLFKKANSVLAQPSVQADRAEEARPGGLT